MAGIRGGTSPATVDRPPGTSAIARTLARVARLGAGYALPVAPPGREWLRCDELVSGGASFEALLATRLPDAGCATARAFGSQLVMRYLQFAWPAATAYALERRVPDVSAANLLVRLDSEGWPAAFGLVEPRFAAVAGDPAAAEAAYVARDDADLLAWLSDRAVDGNAAMLIDAVNRRLLTSRSTCWGHVGSAFVHPLLWELQPLIPGERQTVVTDAEAMLARGAGGRLREQTRLLRVVQGDGEWTVSTKRTCCLSWTLPGGSRCADCPLVRDPDATASLRARLAEAAARGEALRAELGWSPAGDAAARATGLTA